MSLTKRRLVHNSYQQAKATKAAVQSVMPRVCDLCIDYTSILGHLHELLSTGTLFRANFRRGCQTAKKSSDLQKLLQSKFLLRKCIQHRSYTDAKTLLNTSFLVHKSNWIATDVSSEVEELAISLRIEAAQALKQPFDFLTSIDTLTKVNMLDLVCRGPGSIIEQHFVQQETFLQSANCRPFSDISNDCHLCCQTASRFYAMVCVSSSRMVKHQHGAEPSSPACFNAILLLRSWLYQRSFGISRDASSLVVTQSFSRIDFVPETYLRWATLLNRIGGSFPTVLLNSALTKVRALTLRLQADLAFKVPERRQYLTSVINKFILSSNHLRFCALHTIEMESHQFMEDACNEMLKLHHHTRNMVFLLVSGLVKSIFRR